MSNNNKGKAWGAALKKVEIKTDPVTGRRVRHGRYKRTVQRNLQLDLQADDIILQYQANHSDPEPMSFARAINSLIYDYEKLREKRANELDFNAKIICEDLQGTLKEDDNGVLMCHYTRYNHSDVTEVVKPAKDLAYADIKDQYYPNRQTVEELWEMKREAERRASK